MAPTTTVEEPPVVGGEASGSLQDGIVSAPYVHTDSTAHPKPHFYKYLEPILRMGTSPENANGIFNPATLKNGAYHIYCREENLQRSSQITCYRSRDGITIDEKAGIAVAPSKDPNAPDYVGCEDPRAYYDELTGKICLVYVGWNGKTAVNMLALSDDYVNFEKRGPLFHDGLPDKDGAIMGRRADGRVIAVRRPMISETGWGMRVSIGKTLEGPYDDVKEYRPRADWEGERTGASQFVHVSGLGYIGMHHGAVKPNGHWWYGSGLDLFDEGGNMLASATEPQIVPTTRMEREGVDGKEIALCTGLEIIVQGSREFLRAYYGAGDHFVMVAEADLQECIRYLLSPRNRL